MFVSSGSVYGCFNKKIKTDENFQQTNKGICQHKNLH